PERLAPVVTNCLLKDRSKRWSAAQVIEYLSNRQNTTIAPKASPTPQPVSPEIQLKLDVGMDYSKLRDLLKAGKWREADHETELVMKAVAKREKELPSLMVEQIDNFPCADLRTIDQLWVKYSKDTFGFSVQKRIYQGLGGTREYNPEIYRKFGDKVGWLTSKTRMGVGDCYCYDQLTFDIKAPDGHLPARLILGYTYGFGVAGIVSSFASRLVNCNI
ncbi:MAG: GUN4 domain-containing protein, partial [Dolichospermum sp.]